MENKFDHKARTWDDEYRVNRAKVIAQEIDKALNLNRDKKTLEFGCGTGLITFNLIDKLHDVTMVDTSSEMLKVVREKAQFYGNDKQIITCASINSDELPKNSFDCIYTSMVLHHVHDIDKLAKRFSELLNPTGYLCIVDLNKEDGSFHKEDEGFDGHNGFDPEKLSEIISEYGFQCKEIKKIFTDTKMIAEKSVEYSLFLLLMQKKNEK